MALVSYSDSEGSDSESEQMTQSPKKEVSTPATSNQSKPSKPAPGGGFQSLVDRSNPRKLRVALPEIKPETPADGTGEEDGGPARKKARIGGGGGAFSGFNSFLPPPKRSTQGAAADKKPKASTRKVFSLKTGATPGFDRSADAEMRQELALNAGAGADDESIPTAGSLRDGPAEPAVPKEEPKKIGNAMMFKPLSVARNAQKKKTSRAGGATKANTAIPVSESKERAAVPAPTPDLAPAPAPAPQKPKVSLFSIASEERTTTQDIPAETAGTYQPLVYNTELNETPAGPQPGPSEAEIQQSSYEQAGSASTSQTLDDIANDLNLSRAQRRQLLGRQPAASKSRVINFNTDAEYAANQAYLSQASEAELASKQHNPVRSVAPGKHSLQQLVNVANSQKDALEESFASGRRNKKEAGSKYGW
ncbi:conserved hypothetical protein [Paecilomyces variotii No. 5]|uniref:Mitotic checkpoint regulator, MAD2B-interacting-domain-containing protein n=1 Tax=Byssochlamys spectabilis (strain No. 5 / NBRC 109023) TaxID=1356009 RepID=V5HXD8_BYSSN|nr:conserved hypothetical protein [Paecilomyces variotii No. 5]